ncbi:MAG: ATP-binding cassette domain-containing protein [Bacilli bacterium]|nr:ATP-binding cassette domain-containing protein [Bacilli bacterium]
MKILSAQSLTKKYGDKEVFSNLSFSFDHPGIYLLIGENGSGKSTLLSLLAGRDRNYQGSLFYQSEEIIDKNRESYAANHVSYLPQDPLIFDDCTVLDNVLLPYFAKDKKKAQEVLSQLGLENNLLQNASSLSSGEKQRLAVARLGYSLNDIVLLDEPFSNLDNRNAAFICSYLLTLSKEHVVLVVSHDSLDPDFVSQCTVLTLKDGKLSLLQQGKEPSPSENRFHQGIPKESLWRLSWQAFSHNKGFFLVLTILFTAFFTAFSSLWMIADSFKTQQEYGLSLRYQEITYENYLSSSPSYAITIKDPSSLSRFEKNTAYYYDPTLSAIASPYTADMTFSGVAEIQTATFSSDAFVSHGLTLAKEEDALLGRYPQNDKECLISDISYQRLRSGLMTQESLSQSAAGKKILSSYQLSNALLVVGVYQGTLSQGFHDRLAAVNTASSSLLNSYGFRYLSVFTLTQTTNGQGIYLIENTTDNRQAITLEDVADTLNSEVNNPIVNTDKEGKAVLQNYVRDATSLFSYGVLFVLLSGLLVLLSSLGFFALSKRQYLLRRVAGESRKRQIEGPTGCYLMILVSSALLAFLNTGIYRLCLNHYLSVTISQSAARYLIFSPLSFVTEVGLVLGGTLIFFLVLCYLLSPKDLSKRIYQIKEK